MLVVIVRFFLFFFFQAEDGIRDVAVTGVQTCALPIWLQNDLSAVEAFSVSSGRVRFHAPHPQDRPKQIFREPLLGLLRLEALDNIPDLALADRLVQLDEGVRGSEVAVVFGDLVLEDQMVAEGVPGQLGNETVILMTVTAVVREHDIGRDLFLQLLEMIFDRFTHMREEAVPESLHRHRLFTRRRQEQAGALPGLPLPLLARAEHNPVDRDVTPALGQLQDRPPASNLDIVTMRPQTQDPPPRAGSVLQAELHHRWPLAWAL